MNEFKIVYGKSDDPIELPDFESKYSSPIKIVYGDMNNNENKGEIKQNQSEKKPEEKQYSKTELQTKLTKAFNKIKSEADRKEVKEEVINGVVDKYCELWEQYKSKEDYNEYKNALIGHIKSIKADYKDGKMTKFPKFVESLSDRNQNKLYSLSPPESGKTELPSLPIEPEPEYNPRDKININLRDIKDLRHVPPNSQKDIEYNAVVSLLNARAFAIRNLAKRYATVLAAIESKEELNDGLTGIDETYKGYLEEKQKLWDSLVNNYKIYWELKKEAAKGNLTMDDIKDYEKAFTFETEELLNNNTQADNVVNILTELLRNANELRNIREDMTYSDLEKQYPKAKSLSDIFHGFIQHKLQEIGGNATKSIWKKGVNYLSSGFSKLLKDTPIEPYTDLLKEFITYGVNSVIVATPTAVSDVVKKLLKLVPPKYAAPLFGIAYAGYTYKDKIGDYLSRFAKKIKDKILGADKEAEFKEVENEIEEVVKKSNKKKKTEELPETNDQPQNINEGKIKVEDQKGTINGEQSVPDSIVSSAKDALAKEVKVDGPLAQEPILNNEENKSNQQNTMINANAITNFPPKPPKFVEDTTPDPIPNFHILPVSTTVNSLLSSSSSSSASSDSTASTVSASSVDTSNRRHLFSMNMDGTTPSVPITESSNITSENLTTPETSVMKPMFVMNNNPLPTDELQKFRPQFTVAPANKIDEVDNNPIEQFIRDDLTFLMFESTGDRNLEPDNLLFLGNIENMEMNTDEEHLIYYAKSDIEFIQGYNRNTQRNGNIMGSFPTELNCSKQELEQYYTYSSDQLSRTKEAQFNWGKANPFMTINSVNGNVDSEDYLKNKKKRIKKSAERYGYETDGNDLFGTFRDVIYQDDFSRNDNRAIVFKDWLKPTCQNEKEETINNSKVLEILF